MERYSLWELVGYEIREEEKEELLALSFSLPCLIFHHSAFPTLPNRDFKTAWACLYLISEVWADDSQSMFPDRILPPGNVDTDSRDLLCRRFWTFCSQGTGSQGFGAVLLPMGLCFKDMVRQRQSPRLLSNCYLCATPISHWGTGARTDEEDSCVHLERSMGRASFLLGSDIGGGATPYIRNNWMWRIIPIPSGYILIMQVTDPLNVCLIGTVHCLAFH